MDEALSKDYPVHLLEKKRLGFDHQELGALLFERWGLEGSLISAVRHHHSPSSTNPDHLLQTQILHLADWICNHQCYGLAVDGIHTPFQESAWNHLNLSVNSIQDILEKTRKAANQSALFLSFIN